MKGYNILAFSDMHGDRLAVDVAERILLDGKFDLVVYLGDFSTRVGDEKANIDDASYLTKRLSGLAEVKALFGNCDSKKLRDFLEERKIALHGKVHYVDDLAIVGWGGSHPTPFNTPSEFSEEEIERSLDPLMREAAKKKHLILLTHEPPAETKADKLPFGNVGSKSLRKVIEKYAPELNVCGHIHESKSVDYIGKTKVVNVGPAGKGHFLVIRVGEEIETEEINV